MRLQGKIETWNDERGFGFVVQNGTGEKAFVHISALADRSRRPVVGALITYAVVDDRRGPKAVDVRYVDQKRRTVRREGSSWREGSPRRSLAASGIFLLAVAAFAYNRIARVSGAAESPLQEIAPAREQLPEREVFQCEPKKTYCSEVSSCAEARFHQEKCGGTRMDGDGDGIPCEDQFCGH